MASSLSTLRNNLRTQLKIDPNSKVWTDAALNGYINNAYLQVQRDGDYDWKENIAGNSTPTIVSGTSEYSLPSDFVRAIIVMFNGSELRTITKPDARRRDGVNFPTQSTPSHYYIQGTVIGLWPTPDSVKTLNIDYNSRLTSLSSDSDTISFGTDFDSALINYAAYLAWSGYRGASTQSQVELGNYQRAIDILKQTYLIFSQEDLKFTVQRSSSNDMSYIPGNTK